MMENVSENKLKIGLALGSGSAKGWAHIGVIRELAEMGIEPDIVAGSSIGAFVGAAYVSQQLDMLEEWVRSLTKKEIFGYLDFSLSGAGGFVVGEKLIKFMQEQIGNSLIETLPCKFGAIATELESGREVWFRDGPILESVRASIAIPGLITPVKLKGQWLADGGLTNPVPVSLCRAMGADVVIAVNLASDIVGKHKNRIIAHPENLKTKEDKAEDKSMENITAQFKNSFIESKESLVTYLFGEEIDSPGLFEVLASSINIMQDRITRSRMAGDPPDIVFSPLLSELGLWEFDQASVAIEEGRACVKRMRPALDAVLEINR